MFFPKVAKCTDIDCGLTVFRNIAKKELSDGQLNDLLMNGRTTLIKGFLSSKTGNTFDAVIAFDADYKTVFEFPKSKGNSKKRRSK